MEVNPVSVTECVAWACELTCLKSTCTDLEEMKQRSLHITALGVLNHQGPASCIYLLTTKDKIQIHPQPPEEAKSESWIVRCRWHFPELPVKWLVPFLRNLPRVWNTTPWLFMLYVGSGVGHTSANKVAMVLLVPHLQSFRLVSVCWELRPEILPICLWVLSISQSDTLFCVDRAASMHIVLGHTS